MSEMNLQPTPATPETGTGTDPLMGSVAATAATQAAPAWVGATAPKVYDYSNFRLFLGDWLSWKKGVSPSYSGSIFARKAGLQSHTLFGMVVRGKRNLGSSTIRAFAKAMSLRGREELYFERLVLFNQATSSDDKAF